MDHTAVMAGLMHCEAFFSLEHDRRVPPLRHRNSGGESDDSAAYDDGLVAAWSHLLYVGVRWRHVINDRAREEKPLLSRRPYRGLGRSQVKQAKRISNRKFHGRLVPAVHGRLYARRLQSRLRKANIW